MNRVCTGTLGWDKRHPMLSVSLFLVEVTGVKIIQDHEVKNVKRVNFILDGMLHVYRPSMFIFVTRNVLENANNCTRILLNK